MTELLTVAGLAYAGVNIGLLTAVYFKLGQIEAVLNEHHRRLQRLERKTA